MERLAWLAWHFLIPHQKKGSRLQPADLLPDPDAPASRERSPTEMKAELSELMTKFGVDE